MAVTAKAQTPPDKDAAATDQKTLETPASLSETLASSTNTLPLSTPITPPVTGYSYSYETHHSITDFAQPYEQFGGVGQLGYPLTESFIEQSTLDGNLYWVQYFEKAVLEYHPELPEVDKYQLMPIGVLMLSERYSAGLPPTAPLSGGEGYTFKETGQTVREPFLKFWHDGGEVKRFGYPVSHTFEEKNEANGKTYVVQYFERAVMEYHPEEKSPNDVQLAATGSQRLKVMYPDGAPGGASDTQPTPSPTNTPLPTSTPVPSNTPLPLPPITAKLLYKELVVGYYRDSLNVELSITNNTGKDVRAFKGITYFSDIFGTEITFVNLIHEDGIKAGQTISEKLNLQYTYDDSFYRLAKIELKDLRTTFAATQVILADGTELFIPPSSDASVPGGSSTGPDYKEIMRNYKSLTSAKWKEYQADLIGKRMENWVGWVNDVSTRSTDEGYLVRVSSARPGAGCDTGVTDIEFYLSETVALTLSKCDNIMFSGVIDDVDCGLGILEHCTVKMSKVTLASP